MTRTFASSGCAKRWHFALCSLAVIFSCSDPAPTGPIVELVALSVDSLAIQFRDSTSELTAFPRGALGVELDADITWRSRDPRIVTVVPNGKTARLVPVRPGATQVEAVAEDKIAVARVVVLDTVFNVQIVATDTLVSMGRALSFRAIVTAPSGASQQTKWTVSNPAVASIDSSQGTNPVRVVSRDTGSTNVIATSAIDRNRSAIVRFRTARPVSLHFDVEPPSVQGAIRAQDAISPGLLITVRDILGNAFPGTTIVTLGLMPGTGTPSASLFGRLRDTTVGGGARFDTVGVDLPGTGYRLIATSPGLISDTSAAFQVAEECPGIPYVLGSTVSGALGPSSCQSRPNEYYDRYIVSATTIRFFRALASPVRQGLRIGMVFPNRTRVEPGISKATLTGHDSLFVMAGPGSYSIRVYTDSTGKAMSYDFSTVAPPDMAMPAVNPCAAVVDTHSSLTFSDVLGCSGLTSPCGGTAGAAQRSQFRLSIPANKGATVTITSPAFDPCLEAFFPDINSRIGLDDNGGGGTAARLTFAPVPNERAIVLHVYARPPVVTGAALTISIQP